MDSVKNMILKLFILKKKGTFLKNIYFQINLNLTFINIIKSFLNIKTIEVDDIYRRIY